MKTQINEIFPSIQGEGSVVGYKQLFIRFCRCNLNCRYCDTEYKTGKSYTPDELYNEITSNYDLKTFHSISLTGGEPLLETDFLVEFLPKFNNQTKIYLETNATCAVELEKIKKYIDIIAADIKLQSGTGFNTLMLHEKFFEKCTGIKTFAKVVFNSNITDNEITAVTELAEKFNIPLILQPEMNGGKMCVTSSFCTEILDKFLQRYHDVRLIPQVHKFIDVR